MTNIDHAVKDAGNCRVIEALRIMFYLTRTILILVCLTALLASNVFPASNMLVVDTIPRPELEKLYLESDVVAFIKIVSGDTENYDDTVYKSTVITSFKGTNSGETVFFGPYTSYGIGSEYLIFLKNSKKTVGQLLVKNKTPRTVLYDDSSKYFRVQYGGYSILPVSFECAFGPVGGSDSCDYAVDTGTIILPKKFESFPKTFGEKSEDKPFVRKRTIDEFLNKLKDK